MKAKNQQQYTSESDAREKLIVYVYEYLCNSGAKQAADLFKETIGYSKEIKINDSSFLHDWWSVFWDLYCAAPERRHNQPEPSSDARAFMDNMKLTPMSPSIAQQSPPQHLQQPPGPQFMGAPRYGPPPPGAQSRGPIPRMQGPMSQHGSPHPGGPPPPNSFMPASSPRYAPIPGPPPPQPHMNQGMMFSPGPEHQMGPSPGLNRMTPVGEQPQGIVGPPPNGPPPQMVGMPGQQMGPGQGPPPPQVNPMQGNGPPRDGSQGPGGNVNYNVNSPVNPACYSASGEPSTPHSEEYVMPGAFGQEPSDQCDSAEIMKIKQSMQDDTSKMFEKEQSEYSLNDYPPEGKWT